MTTQEGDGPQEQVFSALLGSAVESTLDLNPYLIYHLPEHANTRDQWKRLADSPEVLDHLDQGVLGSEVLRTAFGRGELPQSLAATLLALPQLAVTPPRSRSSIRRVAAMLQGGELADGGASPWRVEWGKVSPQVLSVPLTDSGPSVTSLASGTLTDGRRFLAGGCGDGAVRVWNAITGQLITDPIQAYHIGPVMVAAPRSEESEMWIATASPDGLIARWSAADGRQLGDVVTVGHEVTALSLVESGDAKSQIAVGMETGEVELWTWAEPHRSMAVTEHHGPVAALVCAVLNGQAWVVSGGRDGTVRFWTSETGSVSVLSEHQDSVTSLAISEATVGDNIQLSIVASGSDDGRVIVWDVASELPLVTIGEVGDRPVTALAIGDAGERRILVVGSETGPITLWDLDALIQAAEMGLEPRREVEFVGHYAKVTGLCFSGVSDSRTVLASSADDGVLRLWDPSVQRDSLDQREGATQSALVLAVSPSRPVPALSGRNKHRRQRPTSDREVATADDLGNISIRDLSSGALMSGPHTGHRFSVAGMCYTRLGDGVVVLASAGDDGRLSILRARNRPQTIYEGNQKITALCFVRTDGGDDFLIAGQQDGRIRRWHYRRSYYSSREPWEEWHPLRTRGSAVTSLASNGRRYSQLVAGYQDGRVELWDGSSPVSTPHLVFEHKGPVLDVGLVEFGSDHALISSDASGLVHRHLDSTSHFNVLASAELVAMAAGLDRLGYPIVALADSSHRLHILDAIDLRRRLVIDLWVPTTSLAVQGSRIVIGGPRGAISLALTQ